jgi:L-rhamnose mutarotase
MDMQPPQITSDWLRNTAETTRVALSAAMKLHEQSLRWWSEMMDVMNASMAWQKSARAVADEALNVLRKNADFYAMFMDSQRRGMELLTKGMGTGERSLEQAEAPVRQTWENTFAVMQSTGEAFMQANARAMKCWADLVQQGAARA